INMNGCAAFILITVLFALGHAGVSLTFVQMIPWIFIATLAAIGNAGVPMGCFFLTSAFLVGMNVPLGILGMILPLYAMFDMVETALNVWSDSCITATVDMEVKNKKFATSIVT
ncbi:MAG: cation:dicarboxylase symporter family transporter, partial [Simkaniaceae bacterium]|nr:cation:dicarboxylase symporter family transporter [Simkaniaceae bacterium]